MSPYTLTLSAAGAPSKSSTSAYPVHIHPSLALPTRSSEVVLTTGPTSSTRSLVPAHASIGLQRDWALPAGCDFPGASFFSSEFANSKSFSCQRLHLGRYLLPDLNLNLDRPVSDFAFSSATPCRPQYEHDNRHRRRDWSRRDTPSDGAVAYPITRPRDSRGTTQSEVSSPPPSEFHVYPVSERISVGAGLEDSTSLANCSLVPQLSVSSPLPGSVVLAAPAPPEDPCRAEKALIQLRNMDRRPATRREAATAPPTDGVDIAPETPSRQPGDVEAGSYDAGGKVPSADGREADLGGVADDFCDIAPDHFSDFNLESDSDSGTTLPPPYSSNPSLGEQAF
ncbi:hypothetical protein V8D89_000944 [Ganoderma adspersum]